MDYKKLKISDLLIQNGNVIIGANYRDIETKELSTEKAKDFFINEYKSKRFKITGSNYFIEFLAIDVIINSNIIGYKNFYFLTNLIDINKLNEGDLIDLIE